MNQFSVEGGADIGALSVILSNDRRHVALVAHTTKEIVNIDQVAADKRQAGIDLQRCVSEILLLHFANCVTDEKSRLANDLCRTDYDVMTYATAALADIYQLPDHPWSEIIATPEWHHAALLSIGNMMATVLHTERLWFAEDHPDNASAINYKRKFFGE
jgi:hypothetical protein